MAGGLECAAEASTAIASDREVIDPKYDTCTKQGARQALKETLIADVHMQIALAVWSQIHAMKMIGSQCRQSCKQFISVMFRG